MNSCIVGLRIELLALILLFICPFFCLLRLNLCHSFLRNCAKLTLKIRVRVFSRTIIARILKLGIHMDIELLYCEIESQTPCS